VEQADLVLYDALVDADALRARTRAPCFCVGKRAGGQRPQETIHRLMMRAARQGKQVVRLKGGDPFVFGRGGRGGAGARRGGHPLRGGARRDDRGGRARAGGHPGDAPGGRVGRPGDRRAHATVRSTTRSEACVRGT
jgi:hypothetical protein